MLLSFKTSNFKSFLDEVELRMVPAPLLRSMKYSIINEKIGKEEYHALSSSVVYGPNASGKTNIIGAMDVLKNIVLRGNIKNTSEAYNLDYAAWNLELIPNFNNPQTEPTTFYIKFTNAGLLFQYYLSIEIGDFLNNKFHRRIIEENLTVNQEIVFERKFKYFTIHKDIISKYIQSKNFGFENALDMARNSLDDEELFVCNGLKNVYSKMLFDAFYNWFEQHLETVYSSNHLKMSLKTVTVEMKKIAERVYNQIAQEIGISTLGISLMEDNNGMYTMVSAIPSKNKEKVAQGLNSEIVESYGTVRFLYLFPIFLKAIERGNTVVIDELDSSINPMIITSLINVFHNDEINKHGAQLIFNTHNPIFLNKKLLRRDEIKFVEKNDVTGASEIYSLSDFGTSGKNGVRNTSDYLKNYYINKYGAIKFIDLSKIFKESEK